MFAFILWIIKNIYCSAGSRNADELLLPSANWLSVCPLEAQLHNQIHNYSITPVSLERRTASCENNSAKTQSESNLIEFNLMHINIEYSARIRLNSRSSCSPRPKPIPHRPSGAINGPQLKRFQSVCARHESGCKSCAWHVLFQCHRSSTACFSLQNAKSGRVFKEESLWGNL